MGGLPRSGLAVFSLAQGDVHEAASASLAPLVKTPILAQSVPNPVRTSTLIHFNLPVPTIASLAIFDISGRRITTLLDHQRELAGEHVVELRVQGWRPGVYLCRLEVERSMTTQKMVVVR
jgi:hypothetical protein